MTIVSPRCVRSSARVLQFIVSADSVLTAVGGEPAAALCIRYFSISREDVRVERRRVNVTSGRAQADDV
jgi:hypothetical protein